jgi:UDP-N-acetyl-2-amino-2-deoxyglucuronate dehydrogenase
MLIWIFGDVKKNEVKQLTTDTAAGYLELGQARVTWMLSIDFNQIPQDVKAAGKRTFRSLTMEGEQIEFSDGFTDLHTRSYEEILKGNGFGLTNTRASIELVYSIRNQKIS